MAKFNKTVGARGGAGYYSHYSPVTKFIEKCTGDCAYGQNSTISMDGRDFVVLHADSEQELMDKIEAYEATEAKRLAGASGLFGTRKKKEKAPQEALSVEASGTEQEQSLKEAEPPVRPADSQATYQKNVSAAENRVSEIDSDIEQLEKEKEQASNKYDRLKRKADKRPQRAIGPDGEKYHSQSWQAAFDKARRADKAKSELDQRIKEKRLDRLDAETDYVISATAQHDPETNEVIDIPPEKMRQLATLMEYLQKEARQPDDADNFGSTKQSEKKKRASINLEQLESHTSGFDFTKYGNSTQSEYMKAMGMEKNYEHFNAISSEKPTGLIQGGVADRQVKILKDGNKKVTDDNIIEITDSGVSDSQVLFMSSAANTAYSQKRRQENHQAHIDSLPDDYKPRSLRDNEDDSRAEAYVKSIVRDYAKEHKMKQKDAIDQTREAIQWRYDYDMHVTSKSHQLAKYLAKERGLI